MHYSEFSGPAKLVIDALLMGEEVRYQPYLGFAPSLWACRHFPSPPMTADSLVHDTLIPVVELSDGEIDLWGYPCPVCGKVYVTEARRERWLTGT